MRCNHDVSGYEWCECGKCGKTVRENRVRKWLKYGLWALVIVFIAPMIAEWGISTFHLENYNPWNSLYVLIELVVGCAVIILLEWMLPSFDEKK